MMMITRWTTRRPCPKFATLATRMASSTTGAMARMSDDAEAEADADADADAAEDDDHDDGADAALLR